MQGHFLRAVSLENLGNYKECLKSYLKAYELDVAHPTELLLQIIGAVGYICQMSEKEELTLSDQGTICDHWAHELKHKILSYETTNLSQFKCNKLMMG